MENHTRPIHVVGVFALSAALLCTLGCGLSTGKSNGNGNSPAANTYLYVAEYPDVAQFQLGEDGTLTALNPATVPIPPNYGTNFVTVDPSGQFLFASSALEGGTAPESQYVIGADGTLTPNQTPTVNLTGWNQFAFTPDGRFTFVPDYLNGAIYTYGLSSSGSLSVIGQLPISATGSLMEPMVVDPSGRFVYFLAGTQIGASSNFQYALQQFSISTSGVLTPLSPSYVMAPGSAYSLAFAPNGFLYFPNQDDGTITAFWQDPSTGQLANAGSFATGTGSGSSPASIAFSPAGTYAYVTNIVDSSVTQFTVNSSSGALTMNGPDTPTGWGPTRIVVDPSGKFAFVSNSYDQTISQFSIGSNGRLVPNGTYSTGAQTSPSSMAIAQR